MKIVNEIIELLVTVMCQYLENTQQVDKLLEEDSEWFEGTREEYEEYLKKNHLTENDVCFVGEADELTFD